MSLHYMFYTFCSTWHVAVKLICPHLFAITWLRHDVVMWAHVHYHMVQLFVFTKCRVGFQDTTLWVNPAHATYAHETVDRQTTTYSSSRRSTKSSQLGDIYAMCKSMNNQLKIVRQQWDCSIVAWKTLHPDALPHTPSQTDDEEDGDDDGGDEEDEDASTDGDE